MRTTRDQPGASPGAMTKIRASALLLLFLAAGASAHSATLSKTSDRWNATKAAAYLDQRIAWWTTWPGSARDHGTFCISCHTALPYALARPALRAALKESGPALGERKLWENVTTRVRLWKDVNPYYHDKGDGPHKSDEARGTESVLNALILASRDAPAALTDDTRLAFRNMWSLQKTSGALSGSWSWLQFDNEPFEGHDSNYYGAALAALAVGNVQDNYRSSPDIRRNLELLAGYLNREYPKQSPINQVILLWASGNWPGLITPERRRATMDSVLAKQQNDGGWNLASLAWSWRDWEPLALLKMFTRSYGTPLKSQSDGYATALLAFTLEKVGVSRDEPHLTRALAWLEHNQDPHDGQWLSYSLNNRRDPHSPTGLFMSDAATAFAVLALTAAN